TKLSSDTSETYDPATRYFQSMPSVEVTGNRIWAAMTVGGYTEPDANNYITIGYSDDGGKTWVEPFIIIKNDEKVRTYIACLWVDPDGNLWCYYCQYDTWAIKINNPAGDVDKITCSQPVHVAEYGIAKKPTALSTGAWVMVTERSSVDVTKSFVWASYDKGQTWSKIGAATSVANKKYFHESQIVELKDGRLWMLSRIESGSGGGIEQSFSSDGGKTWTTMQSGLGYPLIGPGSKFHIMRLKSGNLLFVSHNSTSVRNNLTAYLSEDEGKTWSALLLDERSIVSYPDAAQGEDGTIYVIYDRNRSAAQAGNNYPSQEIRLAKFTEEDLKAGAFVSKKAQEKILIAKNKNWHEIVSTNFQKTIEIEKGTTLQSVIESLPKYVSVTDESGNTYYLTGTWKTIGYKDDNTAYQLKFETELIETLEDTYKNLIVDVKIAQPKKSSSCRAGSSSAIIFSTILAAAFIFFKK
ncbi:MAG TPA: sialidase family protein, partial [Clostridia bacterium]